MSESAQHDAGSIQVIHTPAAIPATLWFLLVLKELNSLVDNLAIGGIPGSTDHLEDSAGQGSGRGGYHCFEIPVGDLVEQLRRIVDVKSAPTAILALHGQRPLDTRTYRFSLGFGASRFYSVKGANDGGRIVDVRIIVVEKFKSPPPGLAVSILYRPVPVLHYLFVEEPFTGLPERPGVSWQAGIGKSD